MATPNYDSLVCWFRNFDLYVKKLRAPGLNISSLSKGRTIFRRRTFLSPYSGLLSWYNDWSKRLSIKSQRQPDSCTITTPGETIQDWKDGLATLRTQFPAALEAAGIPPSQAQFIIQQLDDALAKWLASIK